jgi:hypothetical protein
MQARINPCLVALTSLALAVPCAAQAAGDWEPAGNQKQGSGYAYQVFSRQNEDEPFVRYQVRGTIDAPVEVVQRTASRVTRDPAHAPKGQKRTILFEDEDEAVVLTEIDLPAMFSDRDVITRGKISVDPATGVRRIDFKTAEYASAPPKDGVIRLDKTGGYWEFVPNGDERSKVTFETYVDLGGSLPLWFVSGGMAKTASTSFEEVARESLGQ